MDLSEGTGLDVTTRIMDGEWAQYLPDPIRHGAITRVGNLPGGTSGGAPAFELIARLDDGSTVVVETTWRLMRTAMLALDAAWPEYRD